MIAAVDFATNFAYNNDRLPPQNIEVEEAILGGILLDPGALPRIIDFLSVEAFSMAAHKQIYQAAIEVHKEGKIPDLMTVAVHLLNKKMLETVGGENKLAQLVERTVSAVNIDQYAELVLRKYAARKAIASAYEIIDLAHSCVSIPDLILESRNLLDDGFYSIPNSTHEETKYTLKTKNRIDLSDVLPPKLANPLKLLAKNYPCPEEVLLHNIFPIVASLVNPETNILIRNLGKRPEYPIIRSILISEASNRKSDLERMLLSPLQKIQDEWDEKHSENLKAYYTELEEWEELSVEEKKKRKAEQPVPPTQRFFIFTEGTKEGVYDVLSKQPGYSILWAPDEILAVKTSQGEYKGGRGSDTESSLSAFNGQKRTVLRKGTTVRIKDSSSVMGGIQPGALTNFIKDLEDYRGELARYLPFVFDLQAFIVENDIDLDISPALQSLYESLIQMPATNLVFSDRAKRLFTSWQNSKEMQRVRASSPGVRAFIGKLESYCAKIAMLLHLIWEAAEGQKTPPKEIPAGLVQKAIAIAEFYMEQYLRVRQIMGVDSIDPVKDTIFDRLKVMGAITVANMRTASRSFRKMKDSEVLQHFQEVASANPDIVSLERSKQGTLRLRLLREDVQSLNYSTAVAYADRENDITEVLSVRESPRTLAAVEEYSLTPSHQLVTNPSQIVTLNDTPSENICLTATSVSDDSLTHDTQSDVVEKTVLDDEDIGIVINQLNSCDDSYTATIRLKFFRGLNLTDEIRQRIWDVIPTIQQRRLKAKLPWANELDSEKPINLVHNGQPIEIPVEYPGSRIANKNKIKASLLNISSSAEYKALVGKYREEQILWVLWRLLDEAERLVVLDVIEGRRTQLTIESAIADATETDADESDDDGGDDDGGDDDGGDDDGGGSSGKPTPGSMPDDDGGSQGDVSEEEKCDRTEFPEHKALQFTSECRQFAESHEKWAQLADEVSGDRPNASVGIGMIISITKAIDGILSSEKKVTRRDWSDRHAAMWCKAWDEGRHIHQAWDKSPRQGGKFITQIRLTARPYREQLIEMPDSDVALECVPGVNSKDEFIDFIGGDRVMWVIRFECMEGNPDDGDGGNQEQEVKEGGCDRAESLDLVNEPWKVKQFQQGDTVRFKNREKFDNLFFTAKLIEQHFIVDHYIFKVELDPTLPLEIVPEEEIELNSPLLFNREFGERLRHKKSKQSGWLKLLKKNHQALVQMDDGTDIKASINEFEAIPLAKDTPEARALRIYQQIDKGSQLRVLAHENHKGYTNKLGNVKSKRIYKGKYQASLDIGTGVPVIVDLEAAKICD